VGFSYCPIENELHSQNGYCLVFIENFAGKKSNKIKDLEHYKIVTLQHARDGLYCVNRNKGAPHGPQENIFNCRH
jgi:hypothetical protein